MENVIRQAKDQGAGPFDDAKRALARKKKIKQAVRPRKFDNVVSGDVGKPGGSISVPASLYDL